MANLLDNALEYGAPGQAGRRRSPCRSRHCRDGDRVVITIGDHGPGIPEGERGSVLERFVRLESARSRPGFGLGLSLASAVARLHGGSVRLDDNAPGLKAVLSLPLRMSPPGALRGERERGRMAEAALPLSRPT